jgi:hypothetical protein
VHIFLDESGDLGFEFSKQGTSQHFVVTLLLTGTEEARKALEKAVERTIRNKVRRRKKRKIPTLELKGTNTSLEVKQYFYRQVSDVDFALYAIILNKRRVYAYLAKEKERLYNYVARRIIEKIPLHTANDQVILTLDKRKNQNDQQELNRYLSFQLQGLLPLHVPLEIFPIGSHESKGIQAVDLLCWGIFRKYEAGDLTWYQSFREKIRVEMVLFPPQ